MTDTKPKVWACPQCGKTFLGRKRRAQHIRDKHQQPKFSEPSMADLVIDARLNHAMGEPVDDWLMEMFPEEFHD